jgi:type VI protein secretion system component VasF
MDESRNARRRRLRLRVVVGVIAAAYVAIGALLLIVWLIRDQIG